ARAARMVQITLKMVSHHVITGEVVSNLISLPLKTVAITASPTSPMETDRTIIDRVSALPIATRDRIRALSILADASLTSSSMKSVAAIPPGPRAERHVLGTVIHHVIPITVHRRVISTVTTSAGKDALSSERNGLLGHTIVIIANLPATTRMTVGSDRTIAMSVHLVVSSVSTGRVATRVDMIAAGDRDAGKDNPIRAIRAGRAAPSALRLARGKINVRRQGANSSKVITNILMRIMLSQRSKNAR